MTVRKSLWTAPLGWLLFSLAVSGAMMKMAWEHNPMGEFYDYETGIVHWGQFLSIGASWFIVIGVIPTLVFGAIAWAVNRGPNRGSGGAV